MRWCEDRGIENLNDLTDDVLNSTTQVKTAPPAAEPYYRLAVADFPVVLAGRNGRFQWTGTSGVV